MTTTAPPLTPTYAWHFAPADRRLRYQDGRLIEHGSVFTVEGPIEPCHNGLHASKCPLDALGYAPGLIVSRVVLRGERVFHDDKIAASRRTHIWWADATNVVVRFARMCAADAAAAHYAAAHYAAARYADAAARYADSAHAAAAHYAAAAADAASARAARAKQSRRLHRMLLDLAPNKR